ncbi:hypothetical protein BASA81_001174 [Batrachochytrium salamandrivorans]|nr:hypothetical protein BASA81_001174 [Batrachochytrium salamandrivorans]
MAWVWLVFLFLLSGWEALAQPSTRFPTRYPTKRPAVSPQPPTVPVPTEEPTLPQPSQSPSTSSPTRSPSTSHPTFSPSKRPSHSPSESPTRSPSTSPTLRENGVYFTLTLFNLQPDRMIAAPTRTPTISPTTTLVSRAPTRIPLSPTRVPTKAPTRAPTFSSTMNVTEDRGTRSPTNPRTNSPTRIATKSPTMLPSIPTENALPPKLGQRRQRRQLQNQLAANIPNSLLPSPNLIQTVAWEYLYQGVHCLVDFLIQAGGLTYSDFYLGAEENSNCSTEDSFDSCFPATFYFLVTPTGMVNPNNTVPCGIPQCPTCDEVCVFTTKFDANVRPLLYQERLFLLGSTVSLELRSDTKNLVPSVVKHTLSPSSRFCRTDFLDPVERAKIFDESGQPPTRPIATRSPTREGWTYVPTSMPFVPLPGGSSDATTATVLGVLGSLALLGAVFLVWRRNKRRKKKKMLLVRAESQAKADSTKALELQQQHRPPAEYMEDEYAINLSHLLIGQPIGSGSSGQIYAARYEGSDVCIKEILVRGDILMLKTEFDTLRRLKNPHVIQLFGFAIANTMSQTNIYPPSSAPTSSMDGGEEDREEDALHYDAYRPEFPRFLLMMELMDTSLDKLLLKKRQLLNCDEDDVVTKKEHLDWALDIAKQVSLGLRYIHGKEVLHCDVKPHNILLDKAGTVKLCDLGIAKVINANQKLSDAAQQGTVSYMSPELLMENKITKAVDVYAFGIVMWQLFHLQPPHPDFHSHQEIIHQVVVEHYRPQVDSRLDPKIANLIKRCWDSDPALRPSFSQIIQELGNISKLENQFGTVYLETLFQVGDSVLVFTLKNQQGNEAGLMKGKIDAVAVNPAGGFVYNVVMQDQSKIYALHPSDMLLQKPDPVPEPMIPIAIAAESGTGDSELFTIGDAITRVMEEGVEGRRKKKTFSRLPVFPKKSASRLPPHSSSKSKLREESRPQSESVGAFDSRMKSHSSAPFRLAKQNTALSSVTSTGTSVGGGVGPGAPVSSTPSPATAASLRSPASPSPTESPTFGLSLNIQEHNNFDQTFKFDGSSFEFNSGMKLQASGIAGSKSGSYTDLQPYLNSSSSNLNNPSHPQHTDSPWSLKNANRDKYEDRKIIRVGRLGQGDAGTVYSGIHEDSMEIVAIKEVTKFFDRDVRMQAKRELEALLELEHENIVQLYSVYFNAGHSSITFVLEYVLGGSLKDLITAYEGKASINELMLKSIASDLVSALKFCHENKICHLDVKPANVLLTLSGSAKLSDFGLARIFKDEKNVVANTFIGSSLYMSPERMQGSSYSFPADIWGLGLTIAEACVGKYPMSGGNKLLNFLAEFRHKDVLMPLPSDLSSAGHAFIIDCLAHEPGKRPTCSQLQEYEWIEHAKDSRQQAVPERINRTSRLILSEFMDSYVAKFGKDQALPTFLREEQRENLVNKFHLTSAEVQREFDDAAMRLALSNTSTSLDSGSQAMIDSLPTGVGVTNTTGSGGMTECKLNLV